MLYSLFIYLYVSAVRVAALFNKKVARMVAGEAEAFAMLERQRTDGARWLWFHAASLGEFEQGRPLMEEIRQRYPDWKILLTFFSPSGYEVRKDYKGADLVCYLPLDTPRNVHRFLKAARPSMAFFIKYEFWKNYLTELRRQGIPAYSVCSIFREQQLFFRWYGGFYRDVLKCFTHLYVQNEESRQLLQRIGVTDVTVAGDTRFDRVVEICRQAKDLPLVERFKGGNDCTLVAGSSWAPDEDLFIPYFNRHPGMKLVIAPHVIDESHITEIISKLARPFVRYSQATEESIRRADCLIIDCFGLLSSIYRYGEVAYIGGGFGVSIHNTLEAAVYGIPVVFGPNNRKFMEAQGLKSCQGGFEISGKADFERLMDRFFSDYGFLDKSGKKAGNYVRDHTGALQKMLHGLQGKLSS